MPSCCPCKCHNRFRGTQKAASQMGKYMKAFTYAERAMHWDEYGGALSDDPLAAAIACAKCQHEHCDALLTPPKFPRTPRIVRRFDPESDSQQVNEDTQADGDKGEGAE